MGVHKMLVLLVCVPMAAYAAPALKPEQKISRTLWCGHTAEGAFMVLNFCDDGTMTMSYNGSVITKATWTQNGNLIYYQVNDRFCEFHGKFDGKIINGESNNLLGQRWVTKLKPLQRE